MISKEHEKQAIDILSKVLKALHSKNYKKIEKIVDKCEIDDINDYLKLALQLGFFKRIDKYGKPCNFKPKYEYKQLTMDEYDDGSGFYLEYDMTTNSELSDYSLQLKFLYSDNGLISVFEDIGC